MKKGLLGTLIVFLAVFVFGAVFGSVSLAKDTIVVTMNTELATTIPFKAKTSWDYPWYEPVFMRLLKLDTGSGNWVPCITTSWKLLADGKDFEAKIRTDITFQNGEPLTAEDVKFSFEQYKDRKNAHVGRSIYNVITDVEIKAPDTLVFHLSKPYYAWRNLMGGATFIVPKKYYEQVGPDKFSKQPMGSGPFKFVSRAVGEGATYERWDKHPLFKPPFKKLRFILVPDDTVRTQMLKAGQADIIWGVPPQDYAQLQKSDGVTVKSIAYPSFFGLNFVTIHPGPTQNKDLRLAINYAINREEIAEKLFFGQATPIYNFWDPTDISYDPSMKYEYNPAKAKELVKKSGYSPDTVLRINFHALLPASEVALQAVQNYLKAAGINTELRQWEGGALRTAYIKKSKEAMDMGTNYWPGGGRDPNARLTLGIKKGSFFSLYESSPELDKMIVEQQSITDETKRLALLKNIYRQLFEDPAVCALVSQNLIYAYSNKTEYTWPQYSSQNFNLWEIKIHD